MFFESDGQSQSRSFLLRGRGRLCRADTRLTQAAETGKTESRPDLTGAEPVVLSNRPTCPLRVVGLGRSQKEEAVLGVVGCERVWFHVSELWVFRLATLYFVDPSVENHSEPLSAGLEVGVQAGTVVPGHQSRPVEERAGGCTLYCSPFMARSLCWINRQKEYHLQAMCQTALADPCRSCP